jgi:hypothetical protein
MMHGSHLPTQIICRNNGLHSSGNVQVSIINVHEQPRTDLSRCSQTLNKLKEGSTWSSFAYVVLTLECRRLSTLHTLVVHIAHIGRAHCTHWSCTHWSAEGSPHCTHWSCTLHTLVVHTLECRRLSTLHTLVVHIAHIGRAHCTHWSCTLHTLVVHTLECRRLSQQIRIDNCVHVCKLNAITHACDAKICFGSLHAFKQNTD